MNFNDFLNSVTVDSDKLYEEFYSVSNPRLPNTEKTIQGTRKSFDYNLNYSLDLIKKYHEWLLQNYELKPKH